MATIIYGRKLLAVWNDTPVGYARPVLYFVMRDGTEEFVPVVHDEVEHRVRLVESTEPRFVGVFDEDEFKERVAQQADAFARALV